ncbi:MAG: 50S ribosomal protein L17 [Bacteroidales bacterium]|jgi:large subunit ribosomal protein L17|nr:50S ribosomal protein L17 [Bacteroidales bacterium]
MRHNKTINHLGRTSSHRKALLSNMASSLILHKRITTTVAKAKELRKYVEPLITKAVKIDETNKTHHYRVVFSYLGNKYAVNELFTKVAEKVGNRPGGYSRILRIGNRFGDNAEMCIMELVDFNESLMAIPAKKDTAKKTTRRSRSSKPKNSAATEQKSEE